MDTQEYTIHETVNYPGLVSKVLSKDTPQGTQYFHVVTDELSDFSSSKQDDDFHVEIAESGNRYTVYSSWNEADLTTYLDSHWAAVDTWKQLYLHEDRSLDSSLRLAASNKHFYEKGRRDV